MEKPASFPGQLYGLILLLAEVEFVRLLLGFVSGKMYAITTEGLEVLKAEIGRLEELAECKALWCSFSVSA